MPKKLPLNLFAIPFGILGLADCWLVAANFGLLSVTIGRLLVAVATAVWIAVTTLYLRGLIARRISPVTELADPILGPFASLVVVMPTLAAADALYPLSHPAGTAVVDVGIALTVLVAGWLIGQWITGEMDIAKVHPGYFLPSVAGGFVASASASLVGQHDLGQLLFGSGFISWIVIGSIVLGRLFVGPPLPRALMPTVAIEVAPAGVATFAWFVNDGQQLDTVVRLLAAYGVMMIVAQLRLLPTYLRLKFVPGFWAFTFSWAAVTFAGEFWLGVARPDGWKVWTFVLLIAISVFIAAIAARTVVAVRTGTLLPAPPTPPSAPAPSPAVGALS